MNPAPTSDWAGLLTAAYWRDALWFCFWSMGLATWFGFLLQLFLKSAGIHPAHAQFRIRHLGGCQHEEER